jgi:hypothetical protein
VRPAEIVSQSASGTDSTQTVKTAVNHISQTEIAYLYNRARFCTHESQQSGARVSFHPLILIYPKEGF